MSLRSSVLAVVCVPLALTSAVALAQPDKTSIRYEGSAALFNLPGLTIVYPARAGEAGAAARLSAERRAAYLRESWEVDVRVLADRDVSEADRRGHDLLLLGWDNAVLGVEGAARPWRETPEGRLFLDGIDLATGEELLLAHPSPWNPERLLVFLSRIDLELERFNATPLIGSDWAVLRDYLVVQQGNFHEATAWPPVRNLDAEKDHRPELEPWPEQGRSEHITLFHAPGALGEKERAAILAQREAAWREAESRLAPAPPGYRFDLTVYTDLEQKKRRTGVPDPAHGIPRQRELHMTREVAASAGPHEEYHLLARELHGPAYVTALYEGLAFWLEDRVHGASLCVSAGSILDRGASPGITELLDEEDFRGLQRDIGFPAAGLLVAWIVERGGMPALWEAYGLTEVTPTRLAALVDMPVEKLQPSFEATLRACRESAGDEIAFRRALGEAQEAHRVGDHEALVAALGRAVRAKPGEPQVLLDLASARLLAGDYAGAQGDLERLLAAELGEEQRPVEAFAHLQLGRIHDLLGRRDAALAQYRLVLSYPDVAGTHGLAQAGLERPVTPDDLW